MTEKSTAGFGVGDVEVRVDEVCWSGFLEVRKLHLRCRLFEGGWSPEFSRELLVREPGVGVLLYDPLLDKVLFVEQFRVGCLHDKQNGPWALELVAGLQEAGESATDVAIREAVEEAGVRVAAVLPVCEYYNSPGGSSEKLTVFCAAFDASETAAGIFGLDTEHENIRTVIMGREEAQHAVKTGRINNAMSIIAIQWLQLNLPEVVTALTGLSHQQKFL